LFGHSLGARVAFAFAERLRSGGHRTPQLLAVSGCLPPDRRPARDVCDISNDEFLAYLEELGGTPPEALENPELMSIVRKALRADFLLAQATLPVSGLLECQLDKYPY
jgi:medium-chain acyl-[acyl-carrier-protein] hydrolase